MKGYTNSHAFFFSTQVAQLEKVTCVTRGFKLDFHYMTFVLVPSFCVHLNNRNVLQRCQRVLCQAACCLNIWTPTFTFQTRECIIYPLERLELKKFSWGHISPIIGSFCKAECALKTCWKRGSLNTCQNTRICHTIWEEEKMFKGGFIIYKPNFCQ